MKASGKAGLGMVIEEIVAEKELADLKILKMTLFVGRILHCDCAKILWFEKVVGRM